MAEALILLGWAAVLIGMPILAIYVTARTRRQSRAYALLGFLSWFGAMIALVAMVVLGRRDAGG